MHKKIIDYEGAKMIHRVWVFFAATAAAALALTSCGAKKQMEKSVCYDPHFDITTKHIRSDDEAALRRSDDRSSIDLQRMEKRTRRKRL